jgi:hypothetical protein
MTDNLHIINDTTDAQHQFLKQVGHGRIKLAVNIELTVEQAEAAIYGKCLAIHADVDYVVFLTIEQAEGEW